jgi:hypothetical protein
MPIRKYTKDEPVPDQDLEEPPINDYNDDICSYCGRPPRYCKCDESHDEYEY